MQKYTHLIFALLLFLLLNYVFHFPIYLSVFALIGALLPDLDLKLGKLHRRLLHNIWVLIIILFALFRLGIIDRTFAIVFSIGFTSHLIADSLTHMGIMPLWPIKWPKFNGPFKTGSFGEYALMILMIGAIFLIGNFL